MAAIWAAIKAPFARAIAFFVLAFARFGAIKAAIWAAIIAPFSLSLFFSLYFVTHLGLYSLLICPCPILLRVDL
jgi:hypothetical protein